MYQNWIQAVDASFSGEFVIFPDILRNNCKET